MNARDPRLLGGVIALALVGLLVGSNLPAPTLIVRTIPHPQQERLSRNTKAPALQLPRAGDAKLVRLSLRGRPTLLFFTTPSCPYCRQLKQALLDQGLPDLGEQLAVICLQTPGQVPSPEIQRLDVEVASRFVVLIDSTRSTFGAYRIQGVPASYLIDADGRVVESAVGVDGCLKLIKPLLGAVLTMARKEPSDVAIR